MEEFFLEKKGIYYRLNVFESGRPTLVFVHGMSGSSSAWLAYENEFGKKYNVVSMDLRGHGKSVKPEKYEEYAVEKFSEDLHELLDHLGIKKCVLISHSFAVLVSLAFIAEHQAMVSAVVFISPHFSVGRMRSARFIRPFLRFAIKMKPRFSSRSMARGHVDYSNYKNTGDWNLRRMFADIKNTGLWVYLYATAQSYAFDGEAILRQIHIPTLIIHGAKDTIFPVKYGFMMAKNIKGAKLVVLNDVDHIVVLNKSEKTIEVIGEFVKELML